MSRISLGRDVVGGFESASGREWLVTNGLGGFASATVGGANTRRYHGLLVAALRPPVERTVMVAKLDARVHHGGQTFELATNEYLDGTITPHGYRNLYSFELQGQLPVWTWLVGDALIEQRVWMAHGSNTTYVSYTLRRGSDPVALEVQPLCTHRDYHSQHRGHRDSRVNPCAGGFEVIAYEGARGYRILLESGDYEILPEWHWNFRHRVESERGLDEAEDLFRPALIRLQLQPGKSQTIILTAEPGEPVPSTQSLECEMARQLELATRNTTDKTSAEWIGQLKLAADQYIVERRDGQGNALGHTVIAGYPWFSDWGRDTMIALPGLTLSTGRYDIAASVLRTFARFVSEGMLPNRFPDGGEQPEYNTVDATLWYFIAVDEYLRRSNDAALRKELYPVLRDILRWHFDGTRYGIRMDADDALLQAGEPGVQLTWMDAKVGDWVVTARIGKPVEINALWFNALSIMRDMAKLEQDAESMRLFETLAVRVAKNFNERFWYAQGGYLYDVIDGPEGHQDPQGGRVDASLRPNQIFAVSLRHPLLDASRARSVIDVCARELWTPVGLRSLAPTDSRYVPIYQGDSRQRDGSYHQGTVWNWLLGPFALAHYRVYSNAALARSYLQGVEAHLREACIGQISEIMDGAAPFAPRGCYAQAWSVAETLRAWSEINESEAAADARRETPRTLVKGGRRASVR